MAIIRFFILLCIAALGISACNSIPSDPQHTLENVQKTGVLRVGVVHHEPFVDIRYSYLKGSEVEIMRRFAKELKVKPQWNVLSMPEVMAHFEAGKIDIAVGGFTSDIPYKKLGLTRPYLKIEQKDGHIDKHVIAVARGENKFLTTLETFLGAHAPLIKVDEKR